MNEFDQMPDAVEGVELPDVDLDAPGGAAPAKRGGGAIFAAIVVVLLAFQGASSFYLVKKFLFSKAPTAQKVEKKEDEKFGQVYNLDGIIVNPAEAKGSRHLLVDIGLETSDPKVLAELGEREPLLRDNIVTFFSAQRYEVLADITYREKLRDRVKDIVNYNLSSGAVDRVFFVRYVIQ